MIWETAASFVWRHWRLFAAGAGVLVAIALIMLARHDAAHFEKLYEAQTQATASANAKLAISNASIGTMTSALNDKNRESEARAKAYADSKTADAQTIAVMDARQKADASRLETLQRLARDLPDQPGCRVPAALVANLEGL